MLFNITNLIGRGSISRTGHLAEFRKGYQRACELVESDIVIIPFYLRGLWGSQFSRSSDKLKNIRKSGLSRDIIVAFGPALPKDTGTDTLKRKVFDLSIEAWQQYVSDLPTIAHAWIDTVKRTGNDICIADTMGKPLTGIQTLSASIAFSRRIKSESNEENIGILLPTSAGGVIANMAVLLCGKTTVNLNFSANWETISSSLEQANIKSVYTSRKFLEKLQKKGNDITPALENSKVFYMEDLKTGMSQRELLWNWLVIKTLPSSFLKFLFCRDKNPEKTAAILFSSGSEGAPKGIVLSHKNIMANLKQISDVLNTQEQDVIMASLPLFHALGLTVTQFMPLIEGIPMVCHADPTDSVNIAKAIAKYRATILFGTSTFLRLYTKNAKIHPLMLESLRIVVAGAERLNQNVRENFQLKFNKPILEGYGATETTPVASVNLPDSMDFNYWQVQTGGKQGTVGMPLPGSSFKIIDPDTEQELATGQDGMILIGGAQVMQGYLNNTEKTEEVIRTIEGQRWYVTGDKGRIDNDGFLTIVDRYSRFAKVGGEMVGLGAVEDQVRTTLLTMYHDHSIDEAFECSAIALPDDRKGESIILLYSNESVTNHVDTSALKKLMLENGTSPLSIPSHWFCVDTIPKLGSGKTDFYTSKKLAQQLLSAKTA